MFQSPGSARMSGRFKMVNIQAILHLANIDTISEWLKYFTNGLLKARMTSKSLNS